MRIVGIHLEPGAVGGFRLWQWTSALEKRGHDVWHRPHKGTQFEWNEIDSILNGADVVIAGRMHHGQTFAALLAGRDLYHYKLVVDTDDNSDAIPTYNQAFADYHSGAGTARIVRAELKAADLVTVSTPEMLDWAKKYNGNIVYVPNVIDLSRYNGVHSREKEPRHKDDIRIYWGGGGGHYNDILQMKDAVLRVFRERPNVKLLFNNFVPDWAADLPPFRVFMIRFAHFNAYPKVVKWLCADMALVPLEDNEFNRCKSHVKYLDYAMAGIPAVYQDMCTYRSVKDGVTGLKARSSKDWYQHINTLIDYPEVGRQIARNAKADVLANWTIESHITKYESMLQNLIAGHGPRVVKESREPERIAATV